MAKSHVESATALRVEGQTLCVAEALQEYSSEGSKLLTACDNACNTKSHTYIKFIYAEDHTTKK